MPIPLVVSSSSTATGTTRETYRRRLIRELGGKYVFGSVTTQASGLEAERYLISTNLRGDQRARDYFDGLYCYVSVGPTQRKLLSGAYEGSRGIVALDDVYDDPLPVGTIFELSVLPADPWAGADGLNDIINEALESLPVLDWQPLTVVAGQTEYSMANFATYPLKGIQAVAYARTSTTNQRRREMPRGAWSFDQDGESPMLSFWEMPANPGDVIEVGLLRPAKSRIRVGSTWGNSTVGLTSDTDQALYDAATVAAAALPIAKERLARLGAVGSEERAELLAEAFEDRINANFSKFYARFRGSGAQKAGAGRGR